MFTKASTCSVAFFLRQYVMISSHHGVRFSEYPFALCLPFGGGGNRGAGKGMMPQGCRLLCLSLSLSIQTDVHADVFAVKPSAHQHNDVVSAKLSNCHRLKVVLSRHYHRPEEDPIGKLQSCRLRLPCTARRVRQNLPAVGPTGL